MPLDEYVSYTTFQYLSDWVLFLLVLVLVLCIFSVSVFWTIVWMFREKKVNKK